MIRKIVRCLPLAAALFVIAALVAYQKGDIPGRHHIPVRQAMIAIGACFAVQVVVWLATWRPDTKQPARQPARGWQPRYPYGDGRRR